MTFKGLRFAGLEWKNLTASKVMWVVICAIAVMPLLYGALYLAAFQDPYARLNTVPVAVVNDDQGAQVDGEHKNVGDEVVQKLKDTDEGLQWNFVSADQARKGLQNGAYYMTCTIPQNFSKDIASAQTTNPEKATLLISYNESENLLASQIGATVWKEVRKKVSDSVAEEYWNTVFNKLGDSAQDLGRAADGATELHEGMIKAADGSSLLTEKLGVLHSGAQSLETGLGTLHEGTMKLKSGTADLVGGATKLYYGSGALYQGTSDLSDGLVRLKGGSQELVAGTHALNAGAQKLKAEGTSRLSAGAKELAEKTAALPSEEQVAKLNQASGALSAGFGKVSAGGEGLAAGLDKMAAGIGTQTDAQPTTLFGGLNALEAGAGKLNGGMDQLIAGSQALSQGSDKLIAGIGAQDSAEPSNLFGLLNTADQLLKSASALDAQGQTEQAQALRTKALACIAGAKQAAGQLSQGATSLKTGAEELGHGLQAGKAGIAQLSDGIAREKQALSTLSAGVMAEKTGLTQLNGGIAGLSAGYGQLSGLVNPLVAGAPTLKGAIGQLAYGAAQLDSSVDALVSGAGKLEGGSSQLMGGIDQVQAGATKLHGGAGELNNGLKSALEGSTALSEGAGKLAQGAQDAQAGSIKIADGSSQLQAGSATLTEGLDRARFGSAELADGLVDGAKTAREQSENAAAKASMMSDPIQIVDDFYTTVKNYGTGFAPYFMALGLWVGGLVAGFVFRPLNKRLIMSGANPLMVSLSSFIPMAGFALIQATLLMVVLQFGLELQIDNVPAFYGMGYLTALVFAAIMQLLMAGLGFPGRFIAIILLMLQLTACAGTFPIQTTPAFFQVISPYMPMTYVVQAMRQIMTGLDYAIVNFDVFVLLSIGVVSFALTTLVAWKKRTVRMEDLHPILELG